MIPNSYERIAPGYQPGPDGATPPPVDAPIVIIRPEDAPRGPQRTPAPDENLTPSEVPIPPQLAGDPVKASLHQHIVADKLSFVDALNRASLLERSQAFMDAVMFMRLCQDPIARAQPWHKLLHLKANLGPDEHVGPEWVELTRRALKLTQRAADTLTDQLDAHDRIAEALGSSAHIRDRTNW